MGIILNPLLMGSGRKSFGLRVLCALLSLVLPGVVLYYVPELQQGVLFLGNLEALLNQSWDLGIETIPVVYGALVTLTWEALMFAVKKYER
jgi:hypothetical protein